MHFTGLNGSRSLRGQWSTFDSNFSRHSSKSLQTTPPLTPSRRSASTKFKSSGSMTGCHEESLDSVDDRPPTRSSSGRQKNARGEQDDDTASCCIFETALLVVVQWVRGTNIRFCSSLEINLTQMYSKCSIRVYFF